MIGKIAVLLALLFCFSLPACAPDSPDDGGITPPDITIPGGDEPAEERIEAIADGDFQDGFGIMAELRDGRQRGQNHRQIRAKRARLADRSMGQPL